MTVIETVPTMDFSVVKNCKYMNPQQRGVTQIPLLLEKLMDYTKNAKRHIEFNRAERERFTKKCQNDF